MPGTTSGSIIRPARPDDAAPLARMFIDTTRAAFRGMVPDRILDDEPVEQQYARSERNWRRNFDEIAAGDSSEQVFVAVDEDVVGGIVGVAMGCPRGMPEPELARYPGELNVLCVAATHWRRGIGRRLVRAVFAFLVQKGMPAVAIRCLDVNAPARRFYEALGGQLVGEHLDEDEGALLRQVVYGWLPDDVARLLGEGSAVPPVQS